MVLVPMTRAKRPKEMMVPLTVVAGAARVRVVDGRMSCVGRMVIVVPGIELKVEVVIKHIERKKKIGTREDVMIAAEG